MSENPKGKALPSKERAKPELILIGEEGAKRSIISSGRWNDELMARYVKEHGDGKWIKIGELARVAWGQNNIPNKRRVRAYLSKLWKLLLIDGHLLSIEYEAEGHRPAQAVKLYDPSNPAERKALNEKVEKMLSSRELTIDLYKTAKERLQQDDQEAA